MHRRGTYADLYWSIIEQCLPFRHCPGSEHNYDTRYKDSRWANFPSLIVVLLISLAMDDAIRLNSDLLSGPLPLGSKRCFASAPRCGKEDRLRMDSTHARNSFVLSCTGMISGEIRIRLKTEGRVSLEGGNE